MSDIPPSKDDHAWNQMLRYLDGTLPEEDVRSLNRRLKEDRECRELFEDLMLQQIKLKEIGEAEQVAAETAAEEEQIAAEENIVPLPQREFVTQQWIAGADRAESKARQMEQLNQAGRRYRWRAGLALAACLTILGIAVWWVMLPAKLATIVTADNGVIIERGRFEMNAASGMTLRVGDRLTTPDDGRAMFSYDAEATEVTVEPGTILQIELVGQSKQLRLSSGAIVADVAKQDPNQPLRLETPEAEAIVVGTRFKLSTENESTRLEVFEGAVRVQQSGSASSMQVPAGHFVNVTPNQVSTLLPLPRDTGWVHLQHWSGDTGGVGDSVSLNQLMFSGVGTTSGPSQVRGYIHPPLSGAYLFQLAANGSVDLRISDSAEVGNAASVVSVANDEEGTRSSEAIVLQAGRRYYFEMDCKAAGQPLNFMVSWKMPGGMHRVIYGEHLSPFEAR